jgi:predicted mannosyl-3-phosphoglycerate phosphatase (HAD superfamily)
MVSPFRVFHLSAAELALRFAGLSPRQVPLARKASTLETTAWRGRKL